MFHRIDRLPLRVVLYLFDHLRITVLDEDHLRVPRQHLLQRHLTGACYAGGRHVQRPGVRHHQTGVFAGAVGIQIGVGHIHPHPLVLGNIGHRRIGLLTRLKGVVNQRLGLGLAFDDLADKADPLYQSGVIGLLLVSHGGVHFTFFPSGILAQRNGHHRDPGLLDPRDHRRRRIVGDENHLRTQRQQAFNIDLSEIARGRQLPDLGHKAGELRPELFLPAA